jgi:uncharacterized membrane protein
VPCSGRVSAAPAASLLGWIGPQRGAGFPGVPEWWVTMTRIVNSVAIAAPVDTVYDFVTTPATWPRWHPSSLGVSGATDHPLLVGEQVTEQFLVAGRRGQVVWTVTERQAPALWVIAGQVIGGGQGVISYHCRPAPGGTEFEREFTYAMPTLPLRLLDLLLLRRRVRDESEQAVRQLRQAVERAQQTAATAGNTQT